MVYEVCSKIQVSGKLEVVRSLHVGGFGTSTNVDLPLAVNGQGEVYIPGTSLAGALRGWMATLCAPEDVNALWGYQPDAGSNSEGHASRVMIEDAVATLPNGNTMTLQDMELRSGVGIDRNSGTAAEGCLYNRGVIPRGASLEFELSVDITDAKKEAAIKHAIDQLLLAMQSEEIRLGAAKSRGLGRVKLVDCKQPLLSASESTSNDASKNTLGIQPLRISSRTGMLDFLAYRAEPKPTLQPIAPPETILALPRLILSLSWNPIGPLMVKSELTGDAVDILPLMGNVDEKSAFLLPGASIKGALRTQAERIIRTVLQRPLDTENPAKFTNQIRLPLVDTLFGLAADDEKVNRKGSSEGTDAKADAQKDQWLPGLGALFIEDCFSDTRHPIDTLQRLSRVPKEPTQLLQDTLEETKLTGANSKGNVDTQLAYHVAVDRWTGGAADSFLYTNLEPFNIPWESIELSLDFKRFPEDETQQLAGVALMLLLLRDMSDRRIPLGYGTNRGLGSMTLTDVHFSTRGDLPEALKAFDDTHWQANGFSPLSFDSLEKTTLTTLNTAWGDWIEQQSTAERSEESSHE